MATVVMMKNPKTGLVKKGFFGFSWTYFFFGFWVPLFRGELGVAVLHMFFSFMTLGLWQIIVSFLYNKQYTHRLIEKGYQLHDRPEINKQAAARLGIEAITLADTTVVVAS